MTINKDYYNARVIEFSIWLDCAERKIDPKDCNMFQKGSPHVVVADVAASIYADAVDIRRALDRGDITQESHDAFMGYYLHYLQKAHDMSVKRAYNNTATRYLALLKEIVGREAKYV